MTSLAVALKTNIERWAENLRDTSPLGVLVRRGELSPRALAVYLESLRYLFHNSHRNLALAEARSRQAGDAGLVDYFQRKAIEEQGHDSWAASDLAQLPGGVTQGIKPAPSMIALIELQRTLIDRHPLCFTVYILWTEYFTALIGDEWLAALSDCGYDRTQVSAIAKHVEADREHAPAGFSELDGLWQGNPDATVILSVVDEAGRVFEAFCEEICGEALAA